MLMGMTPREAFPHRNATFTLTNVVPQNPTTNQNAWASHESKLTTLFEERCHQAFVLVGAIPSADNWIIKNNVKRVNIPDYVLEPTAALIKIAPILKRC
ncbi:hypothetical protein QQF64_023938 [Cirrhinus molitorella]|uniref:DNA/RNA non-specific endonuclease/pyrophosphatase/phosphodiesterase domain-containing protein n=1 Tax=Cirrhinus molitorella TaxID=172907 RepID=A0ABR3NJZ9_9TELE